MLSPVRTLGISWFFFAIREEKGSEGGKGFSFPSPLPFPLSAASSSFLLLPHAFTKATRADDIEYASRRRQARRRRLLQVAQRHLHSPGWYECGVLSYPRGEKGVVRVEVVEKLAPQLPDDRANGPAKKQLVSSADGASFTRSLVLAQTAAKALAAQTAGPRKRRQPSCWADEAESWSEETESAPEKKQRSMPTAPVCWTESSAEAEAEAKAKAKPTLAKRTELELSTESSAEAMEAALSMAEAVYDSRAPKTATGLFGVALDRRRLQRPYVARVWRGGKLVRLGTFATAENAALAVARSPEGALRLIGTRAVAAAEAAAAAGKEAAAVAVEATYCK